MANNSKYKKSVTKVFQLKLVITIFIFGFIALIPSLKVIPKSLMVTSFHDSHRLVELILISLSLLLVIFSNNASYFFRFNKSTRAATCALVTLAIASSALSASPRHALIEICLFVGLGYLALLIKDLHREQPDALIKQLTVVFWVSITLVMVSFYTGYITATLFKTPVTWPNPLTGFSNIRSFNQYQLWTLGIITLPLLAFDLKKTSTHILLNLALIAWAVLLFFTASRGALLAWGLGLMITTIVYKKIAWPFVRLQLIFMSLGFLGYRVLFELIPYLRGSVIVTGTVLRDTTGDRVALWSQAITLIQHNPVFGVGPMHFAWFSNTSAHPHNSVLQLMCEWGLPAALILLTIAGYGVWCWLKKVNIAFLRSCDSLQQHLGIALFFTLTTCGIYSLVDGVIVMPISQVMMFTVLGLMMGYAGQKPVETKHAVGGALIERIFAAVVLVTLIWATMPEILQNATGSEKRFSIGYPAAGPRLWLEVKPSHE